MVLDLTETHLPNTLDTYLLTYLGDTPTVPSALKKKVAKKHRPKAETVALSPETWAVGNDLEGAISTSLEFILHNQCTTHLEPKNAIIVCLFVLSQKVAKYTH